MAILGDILLVLLRTQLSTSPELFKQLVLYLTGRMILDPSESRVVSGSWMCLASGRKLPQLITLLPIPLDIVAVDSMRYASHFLPTTCVAIVNVALFDEDAESHGDGSDD
jgi:hypothetical protein